jgi:hypothetical protein
MAGRTSIQGTQAQEVLHVREVYDYRFKDAVINLFLAGRPPGTFPRDGRMELDMEL